MKKLSKLSDNELGEYRALIDTLIYQSVRQYLHVSKHLPSVVLRTLSKEAGKIEQEIEKREA